VQCIVPRSLTTRFCDSIRPPASGRIEIFDAVTPGLALRVTERGVKSWSVMYRVAGKLRRDTIGRYPDFGVRAARARAAHAQELVGEGKDPRAEAARLAASESARRGQTVEIAVEAFIAGYAVDRPRWADLTTICRREIVGAWRDRPLSEITLKDGAQLLAAIKRQAPVRANRVCTVVKLLFSWLVSQGYLQGSPMVGLAMPTRELHRDRVLSHAEIRAFWAATAATGVPFGPICRLLLLTGQRRGDILGLRWREISLEERLIEIAGDRYKGGRPHLVPLSEPALAIVRECRTLCDAGELVFPSAAGADRVASGFSKWKARLDRQMAAVLNPAHAQVLPPWRLHDLRRTARTEMSRIGIAKDTAERVLGHAMDDLRGRYDRFDYLPQKRDALDRLAEHVLGLVAGGGR
jgi:integrase